MCIRCGWEIESCGSRINIEEARGIGGCERHSKGYGVCEIGFSEALRRVHSHGKSVESNS